MADLDVVGSSDGLASTAPSTLTFRRLRTRRTLGNGAAALLSRMVGVAAVVVTVAVASRSLGRPQFGVWLTLTTAFTLFLTLGVGAGGAVISGVSTALGSRDEPQLRTDIASALAGLVGAGLALLVLTPLVALTIPWMALLGGQGAVDATQVTASATVTFAAGAVIIPLSLAGCVYTGLQRMWLSATFTTLGALLQVGLVAAGAALNWGLPELTLAFVGGPVAANAICTALLVASKTTRPTRHDVDWTRLRALGARSWQFLLLTLIGVVAYQSDVFIVAHYLGASAVADYAVPFRMFSLAFIVASVFLLPLWPAYGEAWAAGDRDWVRRAFARSIAWTLAATTVLAAVIAIFARPIVQHWVDHVNPPGVVFLSVLALYVPVMAVSTALSMLMNALDDVPAQLRWGSAMAIANVVLSIVLLNQLGVAAPVFATVSTQTLLVLLPLGIRVRRSLASAATVAGT